MWIPPTTSRALCGVNEVKDHAEVGPAGGSTAPSTLRRLSRGRFF